MDEYDRKEKKIKKEREKEGRRIESKERQGVRRKMRRR